MLEYSWARLGPDQDYLLWYEGKGRRRKKRQKRRNGKRKGKRRGRETVERRCITVCMYIH